MSVALDMERRARDAKRERAEMREIIRKIGRDVLTKSERMILEKIVNLWFAHRYGEGVIRPGRDRLAKQCDVHRDTVTVALAKLRAMGIISAVAYARGGTKATRYTVNLDVIRGRFGPQIPTVVPGNLVPVNRRKSGGSNSQNPPVTPTENPPRIKKNSYGVDVRRREQGPSTNTEWVGLVTHREAGNA